MTYYASAIVPMSESAAGFGPYPRTLVPQRQYETRREAVAFLDRHAITLRGALHDHEHRFEAHVLDGDHEPSGFRLFGRDESGDQPWIEAPELRALRRRVERARLVAAVARDAEIQDVRAAMNGIAVVLNGHNKITK